jgi:hypothetical protein
MEKGLKLRQDKRDRETHDDGELQSWLRERGETDRETRVRRDFSSG